MKVSYAIMVIATFVLVAEGAPHPGFWDNIRGAFQGTGDMHRAYSDMREANWRNSDKYFHSRGNHDAAQRGPGGAWAAEVISNAREWTDQIRGGDPASSAADQEANEWGRSGGDPNRYRPEGLPEQY